MQAECQSGVFTNVYGYFQPTFLYESIWDIGTAIALILLDRKYKLGHGRVFALYLVIYGLGRGWIEALRIDPAHHFYGLRLNDWTSIAIVLAGVIGYLLSARLRPGREVVLVRGGVPAETSIEFGRGFACGCARRILRPRRQRPTTQLPANPPMPSIRLMSSRSSNHLATPNRRRPRTDRRA